VSLITAAFKHTQTNQNETNNLSRSRRNDHRGQFKPSLGYTEQPSAMMLFQGRKAPTDASTAKRGGRLQRQNLLLIAFKIGK
jgi:hypothetical protein